MQWVEIINARVAAVSNFYEAQSFFGALQRQMWTDRGDYVRVEIYRNGLVENDWSIHLRWRKERGATMGKSDLGIKLAEQLRPLAMVDHTIWVKCRKDSSEHSGMVQAVER